MASWIEFSSMLCRSSWNDASGSPASSTSAWGSAATAAKAAEEKTERRRNFLKETISDKGIPCRERILARR